MLKFKTLEQFHKENPVVAEGVRALNAIAPQSRITYLTYRSWVMKTSKVSPAYQGLLLLKGLRA